MNVLEITDLTKKFTSPDGNDLCVVNVSRFTLGRSLQVAIKGESGSGKTTFLHLIAGILRCDHGKILIDGEEMSSLSEPQRDILRARKIGYIFQTFNLLQGFTALENILLGMSFGPGENKDRARYLLERVGLSDRADYLPKQLSIGQQQRVAVARALANDPKLVLADEPTGNLDRQRAIDALELIQNVCAENNAALIVVSHDSNVLDKFETSIDLKEINDT